MVGIEKFKIANFRSFKDKENLLKGLTSLNVIVGKNNVGKTNILRAIHLFFYPDSYDAISDRNMIKQITGGATKDPKLAIDVLDDELIPGITSRYRIICDINNSAGNYYSIEGSEDAARKLKNSSAIKTYLDKKFKCVYLSTTDEDIASQAENLVSDMILQYYKQKNKQVKTTIEEFENKHNALVSTFRENIAEIESELQGQFEVLTEINLDVKPRLKISPNKNITDFLLENMELKLDDSYVQDLGNKGAGIQRASLILLSLFLLNEIFSRKNKIILLDEPEAFLYPLLVKKVKEVLEKTIVDKNNFQIFLTTHSPDFLREVNNPTYCFVNVEQKKEEATYARSKRDVDINKYSTINPFDKRTKYQVLKNYGLLDEVDDYEDIIICEGRTDKNYLAQIIRDEEFFPQIRYGKYAEGIGTKSGQQLNYDYVGSGASAVLPILAFLDNVSEINRKVFVLLDGDEEGRKVADKIRPNEYRHLEIKVYRLPDNLEIEDVIFSKEDYISGVLEASEDIRERESQFREVIDKLGEGESLIQKTEAFIDLHKLSQRIGYIKHELSTNLHSKTLRDEWLLKELRSFFDSE